jgi:thioredoxin-related protein
MRKMIFTLTVLFLFITACTDQVSEVHELQFTDLKEHNMKIIPTNPTSNSEIKLVVFDDCTYNTLKGVTRNGNTIDIQKQFNSMMKWPCMIKNDTILIGKLAEGTYSVNYKLLDTSTQVSDPVALSFSFKLMVAK